MDQETRTDKPTNEGAALTTSTAPTFIIHETNAPAEPEPLTPALRHAQVGDVVLFRISKSPLVDRPLVVAEVSGDRVQGMLVFAGEEDRYFAYVRLMLKVQPTVSQPGVWVTAYRGYELGEWHLKEEQA